MKSSNLTYIVASVILLMLTLSSYCISEFANGLQMKILSVNEIPSAYKVMFKLNSVVATLIPLLICLFVFITSKFVMCDFFEKKLHLPSYFCAICFSLIPFLLYEYFFWFNLISYAGNATLSAPEDFLNMKYAFGLTLEDFNIINTCCWGYIYLHLTIYLIQKKYPLHIASLTTLFPSALVYCFLKFIC